jgi:hypothetical protein
MADMKVKNIKRTKVWMLPERDEIIQWIKEGISSSEIRRRLLLKGISLGIDSICRFRKLMVGDVDKYVNERFKEMDKIINVNEEHGRLIAMQRDRINRFYEEERHSEEDNRELRQNIELYNYLLESHIKLKQQMGLIAYPIKKSVSMETAHIADLQDAYDKILKKKMETKVNFKQ